MSRSRRAAARTAPAVRGLFDEARVPTHEERAAAARAVRVPPYWLDWRTDGADRGGGGHYVICWNDPVAGTRRRKSTSVGGGPTADVPLAARKALALHVAAIGEDAPGQPAEAEGHLYRILTRYAQEHVGEKADPVRYLTSIAHWCRFLDQRRRDGLLVGTPAVSDVSPFLITAFIAWRKAEGVGGPTISRDIAALRGALRHAWKAQRIPAPPFVRDIHKDDRVLCREIEFAPEQIAAIFEAAVGAAGRFHVADFTFVHLSTHARTQAILECDLDLQYDRARGVIFWNRPGRTQTHKHRSMTRACPALAHRLEGRSGQLIQYRQAVAQRRWAQAHVPEWTLHPVADIDRAWASTLIAAHEREPRLGLAVPVLGPDGRQLVRIVRDTARRPVGEQLAWKPVGPPNTLRHTIHTYLEMVGVPEAQIDSMSGHNRRKGSGAKYLHLRPEYQRDALAAIEAYWSDLDKLTTAHRRTSFGPAAVTTLDFTRRAAPKNG